MKKLKTLACITLAATILTSAFAFGIPSASAEDTEEDTELAAVGAEHRSVSWSSLPSVDTEKLNKTVTNLYADKRRVFLDIYEKHQMTVLDSYSHSINGRVSFSSSDSKIAEVSETGMITAVSNGTAEITASDPVTGGSVVCGVYVNTEYHPTEKPTIRPTEEPTEKPTQKPTQKPTPKPTEPPTQKPTQAPTQKPTQPPTQKPTQPATQKPTQAPTGKLELNATSATVYKGCIYQIIAKTSDSVSYSSSDRSVATVDGSGIVTAAAAGTATITVSTSSASATCKITVKAGESVNISHTSATVDRFMTFLMSSSTSGVTWSSSDTSIATVENGYVYGVKAGTAVITASTSKGAATCLMTVDPSNVVRFAYCSPNCAAKNQTVTLICITDTMRTGVRFGIDMGSSTRYVDATSCTRDEDTYVWKGTTSFSQAGTYEVKAYSQFNNGTEWYTCEDGYTTAFVADSTDRTTTVCAERRASDEVIDLISTFEGFLPSVYSDPFTGDPTLGYGRVVYVGEEFYNDLTQAEAYAYLVQTVNNNGYSDSVNDFLMSNNVKYNQQQFDALVCFVYNTGAGPLYYDDDLINALLDCSDGSGSGSSKSYYINGDYVRIRKGAGTSYDIIRELSYGTALTVLSTSNSDWYYVELSDGTRGYVSSDYISYRSSGGNLDLNYINKQNFINKLCQYHHAGGQCVYGLLYRRVDETEMFFYGDYEPSYGDYKYPISFTCANNSSFHT
nr:Ig-like domain-containing protein [uncultured Ruminococcus sp.]